jgi:hypothetical protein
MAGFAVTIEAPFIWQTPAQCAHEFRACTPGLSGHGYRSGLRYLRPRAFVFIDRNDLLYR